MNCILPILTILCLGLTASVVRAQPRPTAPPKMARAVSGKNIAPPSGYAQPAPSASGTIATNPAPGNALLAQSIASLTQYNSLAAKIRQRVELFDQQLVGTGSYFQGPVESHLLHWELKIRVGEQVTSLQQVCDGRTLWMHRQIGEKVLLEKVDFARSRDGGKREGQGAGKREPASTNDSAATPSLDGGLTRLLKHLNRSFRFTSVQPMQLGNVPMHAVRGEWQTDYLIRWLPKQQAAIEAGKPVDTGKLADHLPDHAIVFLGRDDLFPYRIEYRRKTPTLVGKALGKTDEFRTVLVMEFFDVQFNPPLEKSLFTFEPGNLKASDKTDVYLKDER